MKAVDVFVFDDKEVVIQEASRKDLLRIINWMAKRMYIRYRRGLPDDYGLPR